MASGGRVLIHATVTSIKDDQILYPSCIQCYSKLQHEEFEKEWYCLKCGLSCLESKVVWRFRIALTVADQHSLTDLAIFGSTLERYFGTTANNFQKYMQKLDDENLLREEMLFSALEETFVGHQFYFGIKSNAKIEELRKFHGLSSPVSVSTISKVKHGLSSTENKLSDLIALQIMSLANVSFTHNTVYYNLNQYVQQNTHCSFNTKWTQSQSVTNDNSVIDKGCLPLSCQNSTFFSSMVNGSLSDPLEFSYERSVNTDHEIIGDVNFPPSIIASSDKKSSNQVKENNQDSDCVSKNAARCDYDICDSFPCGVRNTNNCKSRVKFDIYSSKNFDFMTVHNEDKQNFDTFSSLNILSENSSILCRNLHKSVNCDSFDNFHGNESFSIEIMRCETKCNHSVKIPEQKSLILDNNDSDEKQESHGHFQLQSLNELKFVTYNDARFSEWNSSIDLTEKPTTFQRKSQRLEEKNPLTTVSVSTKVNKEETETSDQSKKLSSLTKDKLIHTAVLGDFPESANLDEFLNSYCSEPWQVLEQGHEIHVETKSKGVNCAKSVPKPATLPSDFLYLPQSEDLDQFLDSFDSHLKDSSAVDEKVVLDDAIPVKTKFSVCKVNESSSKLIHIPVTIAESIAPGTTNALLRHVSKSNSVSPMYSDPLVACSRIKQKDNSGRVLNSVEVEFPESEDLFSSGYLSFNFEDLRQQSPKQVNAYLDGQAEFSSIASVEPQNQEQVLPLKLWTNSECDNYCDNKLLDDTLNGSTDLFNSSFLEELVGDMNSVDRNPGSSSVSESYSYKNKEPVCHMIGDEGISNGKSLMEDESMCHFSSVASDNCEKDTMHNLKAISKGDNPELSTLRHEDAEFETPCLDKYNSICNDINVCNAVDDSIMEQLCSQNELVSPLSTFKPKHVRFSRRLSMVRSIQLVDISLNLQKNSSPFSHKGPLKTCMRIEESDEDTEMFSQDLFSPSPVRSSMLPESESVGTSSLDPRDNNYVEENNLGDISHVSTPQACDVYRSICETQSTPDLFSP